MFRIFVTDLVPTGTPTFAKELRYIKHIFPVQIYRYITPRRIGMNVTIRNRVSIYLKNK